MLPTDDWSPALFALTNGRHEPPFVDDSILDKEITYVTVVALFFFSSDATLNDGFKSWSKCFVRDTDGRQIRVYLGQDFK